MPSGTAIAALRETNGSRRIDALQAVVVPPVEPVSRLPWLAGGVVLGLALALGVAAAL
jgi:uncharacterized protein involved in exopolysaccharide biosynthesis